LRVDPYFSTKTQSFIRTFIMSLAQVPLPGAASAVFGGDLTRHGGALV
jgi:hypothetical protein